jgi:hypothetical protein
MSPWRGSTPRPTDRQTVGRNVNQIQTQKALGPIWNPPAKRHVPVSVKLGKVIQIH